MQLPSYVVRKN